METKHIIMKSITCAMLMMGINSTPILASDINYNYIEGRYIVDAELTNNIDGDGFELGGSFRINSHFYLAGSYQALGLDFNNDIDTLKLGGGFIYPLTNKWDANFAASFVNIDTNNNDDNGFELSAGVRGKITPKIEGRASVNYIDVNDNDTYITVGGDYFIMPHLSVGVEADVSGDIDTVSIGARYYF